MKKKVFILWIDDDSDRKTDAENIEDEIKNLSVMFILADEFIHETSKNPNSLYRILGRSGNQPDLYFIDFRLDRHKDGKIKRKGWSVASQIRELKPDIPIYGLTADDYDNENEKVGYDSLYFDKTLTLSDVEENGANVLYYDALDFDRIRKVDINPENILKLLRIPKSSKDHLFRVLPEFFFNKYPSSGNAEHHQKNAISFSRWVFRVLLVDQGPLFDELFIATRLGVTQAGFKSIKKNFIKAQYEGIFSLNKHIDRWWVSEVESILYSNEKSKKIDESAPWILGPTIFNIKEKSKCIVCNGDYPETVGINVNNISQRRPVHYSCSFPHPIRKRKIFFEDIRAFRLD